MDTIIQYTQIFPIHAVRVYQRLDTKFTANICHNWWLNAGKASMTLLYLSTRGFLVVYIYLTLFGDHSLTKCSVVASSLPWYQARHPTKNRCSCDAERYMYLQALNRANYSLGRLLREIDPTTCQLFPLKEASLQKGFGRIKFNGWLPLACCLSSDRVRQLNLSRMVHLQIGERATPHSHDIHILAIYPYIILPWVFVLILVCAFVWTFGGYDSPVTFSAIAHLLYQHFCGQCFLGVQDATRQWLGAQWMWSGSWAFSQKFIAWDEPSQAMPWLNPWTQAAYQREDTTGSAPARRYMEEVRSVIVARL